MAEPTASPDANRGTYVPYMVTDPSYAKAKQEGGFGFEELTEGDVMFQSKKKKKNGNRGGF